MARPPETESWLHSAYAAQSLAGTVIGRGIDGQSWRVRFPPVSGKKPRILAVSGSDLYRLVSRPAPPAALEEKPQHEFYSLTRPSRASVSVVA